MPNGRCKVHGGKSTGPRTAEGLERSRRANWKHGHFSREAPESGRNRIMIYGPKTGLSLNQRSLNRYDTCLTAVSSDIGVIDARY